MRWSFIYELVNHNTLHPTALNTKPAQGEWSQIKPFNKFSQICIHTKQIIFCNNRSGFIQIFPVLFKKIELNHFFNTNVDMNSLYPLLKLSDQRSFRDTKTGYYLYTLSCATHISFQSVIISPFDRYCF
jgi:hypothetical protein